MINRFHALVAVVFCVAVHIHDWHATILHLLGFDHERLTFRHAGRDMRLTDVKGRAHEGILVGGPLASHRSISAERNR